MDDRLPKPLYLDAAAASVRLDGRALRLSRPERADQLVPLSRVSRAVVRGVPGDMLGALLEIVRRGGSVHFQSASGDITAVLQAARPAQTDATRELTALIQHHPGIGPFRWWRDAQRRHAWSLVFRRGYPGDPEGNRRRLIRYLLRMCPGVPGDQEYAELAEQLHAWLQAELLRQGLQPVVGALAARGEDMTAVLRDCLSLPLAWQYVRWRREQPQAKDRAELLTFFELQACTRLAEQLSRHVLALAGEYHASWSALRLADAEDRDHAEPPLD